MSQSKISACLFVDSEHSSRHIMSTIKSIHLDEHSSGQQGIMQDLIGLTLKSTPVLGNLTSVAEFGTHLMLEPILQKMEDINKRLDRIEEEQKKPFQFKCCNFNICQLSK